MMPNDDGAEGKSTNSPLAVGVASFLSRRVARAQQLAPSLLWLALAVVTLGLAGYFWLDEHPEEGMVFYTLSILAFVGALAAVGTVALWLPMDDED